jgi:hypothetical protein
MKVSDKTPEDMDKEEMEMALETIYTACEVLGWDIALKEGENFIAGFVIGVNPYVEDVLDHLEDEYEIYGEHASETDITIH